MDAADRLGFGEVEVLVAPLQLGTAEVGGGEVQVLQRRSHGAVDDEDALVEELLEEIDALTAAHSGTSAQSRNGRKGELPLGRISVMIEANPSASSVAASSTGSNPR